MPFTPQALQKQSVTPAWQCWRAHVVFILACSLDFCPSTRGALATELNCLFVRFKCVYRAVPTCWCCSTLFLCLTSCLPPSHLCSFDATATIKIRLRVFSTEQSGELQGRCWWNHRPSGRLEVHLQCLESQLVSVQQYVWPIYFRVHLH